jgi:hypothetical protein
MIYILHGLIFMGMVVAGACLVVAVVAILEHFLG